MLPTVKKQLSDSHKKRFEQRISNALRLAGMSFHQEYRFDSKRMFRFDFAFPDQKIAIEFEGGVFSAKKSGHTSGMGYFNNCDKYNLATLLGWRILRYTSKHLDNNGEFKIPDDVKGLMRNTDQLKLAADKIDSLINKIPEWKK